MIKVNFNTEKLSDDVLRKQDLGEGFVTISFNKPLIPDYFTRVIPLLKEANPTLMITAISIFPGFINSKSIGVKEVWINFEKKVSCESNPVFGTENFMDP